MSSAHLRNLGRRSWSPLPIPHRTIPDPKGQDLDFVNVAHSHLVQSDWAKLNTLATGLTPFRIKHTLLRIQKDSVLSLEFFNWVELQRSNSHTLETNSIILHILTKANKFKSAESLLRNSIVPKTLYCPSKLFDAILYSYRLCDSSPRVFDSLFKTYAHMKKFRIATDTFCQMRDYGFLPTIESCNAYMSSLIDLNRTDIALAFYKEMRRCLISPNVYTLNMVICALCKSGGRLYEEMLMNGIKVDILTYNALILGLCKEGKTKKAAYLVKKLYKENLLPNASTFSSLISGQCVRQNSERAFQLYKIMKKSGYHLNADIFSMLISTFCKNEDFDGALHLLREMMGRSMVPDSSLLGELYAGLSRCGKDEVATSLHNEMEARHLM
uniref:Pentatricopeptide repeat-containing protein At4g26680, mitochondrial n=1 Tax=Nelumbo nucifera TaxID=4432 RepID=A0A822YT82_NELNU|nr:TPA_asm: hypothetical protein HUJ06_007975 [Nelumbo nucifera]